MTRARLERPPGAGPRLSVASDPALFWYAVVLLDSVKVCLAFDLYDIGRWLAGERFVLGSVGDDRLDGTHAGLCGGGGMYHNS